MSRVHKGSVKMASAAAAAASTKTKKEGNKEKSIKVNKSLHRSKISKLIIDLNVIEKNSWMTSYLLIDYICSPLQRAAKQCVHNVSLFLSLWLLFFLSLFISFSSIIRSRAIEWRREHSHTLTQSNPKSNQISHHCRKQNQ